VPLVTGVQTCALPISGRTQSLPAPGSGGWSTSYPAVRRQAWGWSVGEVEAFRSRQHWIDGKGPSFQSSQYCVDGTVLIQVTIQKIGRATCRKRAAEWW